MGRNRLHTILTAARHGYWDEDMEDELDTPNTPEHVNRPTYNRPDDWN